MKNNEILKIYGTDYKELTKTLLAEADLAGEIPSADARIGIKPNLVAPTPACYGATTHPEVVEGIVEYLKEHGFHRIAILEGSWVGDRTEESFEICGYNALAHRHGVELWDMQKDTWHTADCGGMELALCDSVNRIDFLINVPVLKGHCQTRVTCALKNMKGLIPNSEKRHFHAMGLHKPIAHLNIGIHQDFIVVDHICGDLDFEDGGNPVVRNCIMAAKDPVLVDSYVCELLHFSVEEVPYIVRSEELGVGSTDLASAGITTIGEALEQEELSRPKKIVEIQDKVEEVESCSACYGNLIPALDRLKEEGLLKNLTEKIAIGQGYRGKTGALGVGLCTSGFDWCIKGCPPEEETIYRELKQYLQNRENAT